MQRRASAGSYRYFVNMSIGNTDLECLERCQAVIGGNIYGPYERNGRKPMLMLKVMAAAQVGAALDRLMPYLSTEKRDQAKRVIDYVAENQRPVVRRGWPKGKPRGRKHFAGEPCAKGHPGTETYEYTNPAGRTMRKCRRCQRERDAGRAR